MAIIHNDESLPEGITCQITACLMAMSPAIRRHLLGQGLGLVLPLELARRPLRLMNPESVFIEYSDAWYGNHLLNVYWISIEYEPSGKMHGILMLVRLRASLLITRLITICSAGSGKTSVGVTTVNKWTLIIYEHVYSYLYMLVLSCSLAMDIWDES